MPYMRRMLVDGVIAMSIATAFLLEWHGEDHEVLMTAMSVFSSTTAIDYVSQSPNPRLFIARLIAMAIGLFAMMTGDDAAKVAFWVACAATVALSWVRLYAFVKKRREDD